MFARYKLLMNNPRFLLLWIGSFISGIGDSIAAIVIVWTIYNQTSNPFLITLALICLEFPSIVFGPVWGVYIDRSPKKFVVSANIVRGFLFFYLLFVPLNSIFHYALFLILLSISSSLAPITKVGENMVIMKIVDNKNLVTANSLMYIQFDLSLVIGPLIGGVLASYKYIQIAFLINAISFLIAAGILAYVFPKRAFTKEIEGRRIFLKEKVKRWYVEFREGISFIFKHSMIASFVMISFLWNLFIWGTSPTLLPIFNKVQLLGDAKVYGILGAATSLGIVAGSLIVGMLKIEKNLPLVVMLSIVTHGAVYSFLSITQHIWIAVALFLLSGIVSAPAMIYMRTIIQRFVPEEKFGRISTVMASAGAFGFPLGTSIASFFVATLGESMVSYAFLVFGGTLLLTAILLTVRINKKEKDTHHVQDF